MTPVAPVCCHPVSLLLICRLPRGFVLLQQRWTSGSTSKMSVAAAPAPSALFSWVGIIMYLPTEDPAERKAITDAFFDYRHVCEDALW